MFTDIIVLAGGIGERLWPVSTPECPKQFMRARGDMSFVQLALENALFLRPEGDILVITRACDLDAMARECGVFAQKLKKSEDRNYFFHHVKIIGEPVGRHSATAVWLACVFLYNQYQSFSKMNLFVMASDHLISPKEAFVHDCELLSRESAGHKFSLFGIPPTGPETGYGYIETVPGGEGQARKVASFHEKPTERIAREYVASGNFFWNSGMFAFTTKFFAQQMEKRGPEIVSAFKPLQKNKPVFETRDSVACVASWKGLEEAYGAVGSFSLEKGIAEKLTKDVVCVSASFSWSDIGNWDSYSEITKNCSPELQAVESKNNFVYSDIPVALCGVEDLIVVIHEGKALVCKRGASNLVKDIEKDHFN
jgi:mannose-1-phosphate guanylyltransferase